MANKNDVQALLELIANLSADELKDVTKQANALKRDRKAKADKAALAAMFEPLFDVIDNAITENPNLAAYLNEQRDSLRITVKASKVNRANYRSYRSRNSNGSTNGGRNGTTVWHRVTKDGEYKSKVVEFASLRALCNFYGVANNGASGRVDAKKHGIDFLEVRPEGEIITLSA